MENIYDELGVDNLEILVESFYSKVFMNDIISHLFKSDQDEIKSKQFKFLSQFLGGPELYTREFGHPKMRRRHLPHAITQVAKEEWLKCMFEAIEELSVKKELKDKLKSVFPILAQHMVNR